MKVALCTLAFPEFTVSLARALQQYCDVTTFVPDRGPLARDLNASIRTFPYQAIASPFEKLRACGSLTTEIRRLKPDIVHFQGSSPYLLPFLPFLAGLPIVKTLHDPVAHSGEQQWPNTLSKWLITAKAKRVIVMADAMRELCIATDAPFRHKIDVIPHGIYECYREGPQTRPDWLPEGARFILFFGRVSRYKGIEDLLDAFHLVARDYQGKLVIAGKQLYPLNIPVGLLSRVIAIDQYIPDDVLRHLFRKCEAVVLPYRDATQSGVLMLAYAFGRPVIATDVGGLPEMIRSGETGILVPPQ